ncbi:DEAD/DEAH box helicase [Desulfobacterales bacterium HSG16]|nr:DEAD/DEAH box helicase [Desulfobacterales bacterium HSG16]
MNETSADINEYINSLLNYKFLGSQVSFKTLLPGSLPCMASLSKPMPAQIEQSLTASGIKGLYLHQKQAIDLIRADQHVVVATPTASGKTLVYNLPVFEKILLKPDTKALYLFPLKALAQDQLRNFTQMAEKIPSLNGTAAIYDGDTSSWFRKKIRENPPNVLMTNPEMLHLSILAYHDKWTRFLKGLEIVVVDEVHTYRGLMGSHMALVFRRLLRLCRYYNKGCQPLFVFNSATVANPAQLAEQLTGLDVKIVSENGAPVGRKHLIFIDSVSGPAQTAILLLKAALHRKLRTIVYTQSRKLTELMAIWVSTSAGKYADRISSYRAGFLPEERRKIEAKLSNGELLAVISTSALELGIDIGDLDLCILVGYPGTIVATWQRGGRVGRKGQDSAIIIIPGEDALDRYFIRHPRELIEREPESAVINPFNGHILKNHLMCAAAEIPLKHDEPFMAQKHVRDGVASLEYKGDLLMSADGKTWFSKFKAPHRQVNLRGTGSQFQIICTKTGASKGSIDGHRAFKETHPGAVYLHNGETYVVKEFDHDGAIIKVSPEKTDYYTRVRSDKKTEILEVFDEKQVWGTKFFFGSLRVTEQITGYETLRLHGRKKIRFYPLDMPSMIFETQGLWFIIPDHVRYVMEKLSLHFMGGIHAVEHAAIGIFPLLIMADRNDMGGISIPMHEQTKTAAIFIYDGVPGGAGLCLQAFKKAESLLDLSLQVIEECSCSTGCPSCVQSPKCGSGNRPIDKAAAMFVLKQIKKYDGPVDENHADENQVYENQVYENRAGTSRTIPAMTVKLSVDQKVLNDEQQICAIECSIDNVLDKTETMKRAGQEHKNFQAEAQNIRFGVFDIETQRSAQEVGGWHRADLMLVSCVVMYDSKEDRYIEYLETQVESLIERLNKLDLVIGFNIKKFDYHVLRGYTDFDFKKLPTLDLLEEIHNRLGYRLSLDHLAQATLGTKKSANGLQALKWWKQGQITKILKYCKKDVEITKDLFLFGKENKYLVFKNKAGKAVRVPVEW